MNHFIVVLFYFQFTLQLLKDILALKEKDPEKVTKDLLALEKTSSPSVITEEFITQEIMTDEQSVNVEQLNALNNRNSLNDDVNNNIQEEYPSGDMNGYYDQDILSKPHYVVCRGYTAKQKDEVPLPIGTEVCVLDKKDSRSFVVALSKHGQEFDRGWLPSFCLQLKKDAIDISSEQGV